MKELITSLACNLKNSSDDIEKTMVKQLLTYEYEKELKIAGFDTGRVYRTKDGRWKISTPIQICRKNRDDCIQAVYEFFYGKMDKDLGDVYLLWLQSYSRLVEQGHRSSITIDSYRGYYKKYIEGSVIESTPIRNIKTINLHKFYADCAAGGSLTRKSLNNLRALVNHIFNYAVLNNYLEVNYAKEVNLNDLKLKDSNNSRDVYSDEDRDRLMAMFKLNRSDPCANALAVLFCTGMRSGEVRALKWEDIDFKGKSIYVHREMVRRKNMEGRTVQVCMNHTKALKEEGNRVIPMPKEAVEALLAQKKNNPDGEFVFMENKSVFHQNKMNKALKKYCRLSSVNYLSCHKIRFWAVTAMYAAGISQAIIQHTAGHLTPATTDHYKRISKLGSISQEDAERIYRAHKVQDWLLKMKKFWFRRRKRNRYLQAQH